MSKELKRPKQLAHGRVYRVVPSGEVREIENDKDPRIRGLFVRGVTLEPAWDPKVDRPPLRTGSRIGRVYISSVAIQYPHNPDGSRLSKKPWKVGTHKEPDHSFGIGIASQVTERWVGMTVGSERARGKGIIDGRTKKISSHAKPNKDANPEYFVVFKKNGRVKRVVGMVGQKMYREKIHKIKPGTEHSSRVRHGAVFALKTVENTKQEKRKKKHQHR